MLDESGVLAKLLALYEMLAREIQVSIQKMELTENGEDIGRSARGLQPATHPGGLANKAIR